MSIDMGGRVHAALVTCALGLVCLMRPGVADASDPQGSAPSFAASTTVAGIDAPAAVLRDDAWTFSKGMWRTSFRSVAPAGGETVVSARWRSPVINVRPGQHLFRSHESVTHDASPTAQAIVEDSVRVCKARGSHCSPWFGVHMPTPSALAFLPFSASFEGGWARGEWVGRRDRIRLEWRFAWHQTDADLARVDLAVGL
jgi:hypothetical protein